MSKIVELVDMAICAILFPGRFKAIRFAETTNIELRDTELALACIQDAIDAIDRGEQVELIGFKGKSTPENVFCYVLMRKLAGLPAFKYGA